MQTSVSVGNAILDAIETAIGVSPTLKFFDGAMPANVGVADAGTVVSTMTLPSDWMAAAATRAKAKSGTWQDASADASGLVRYYRIYAGATCHLQGLCGQNWAGSSVYKLNQHVVNGNNVYKCTTAGTSASSGGPTGTGTGITDGTCVWDYVGPKEMILDNGDVVAGQQITVNTYQWNENNA